MGAFLRWVCTAVMGAAGIGLLVAGVFTWNSTTVAVAILILLQLDQFEHIRQSTKALFDIRGYAKEIAEASKHTAALQSARLAPAIPARSSPAARLPAEVTADANFDAIVGEEIKKKRRVP